MENIIGSYCPNRLAFGDKSCIGYFEREVLNFGPLFPRYCEGNKIKSLHFVPKM
jgi:hypothetical protein